MNVDTVIADAVLKRVTPACSVMEEALFHQVRLPPFVDTSTIDGVSDVLGPIHVAVARTVRAEAE